jgi:hypothetical protein
MSFVEVIFIDKESHNSPWLWRTEKRTTILYVTSEAVTIGVSVEYTLYRTIVNLDDEDEGTTSTKP